MYFSKAIIGLAISLVTVQAHSQAISKEAFAKIVKAGVSENALTRLSKFMYENKGRSFQQQTYSCEGKAPESIAPCEEAKRSNSTQTVTLESPKNVAIVDFTLPSSQRRFFLINTQTGAVKKYYSSHGIGSGRGDVATAFSNKKDSRQTSLGIYLTGGTYYGKYGRTLRMYGLEASNDQAYNRDIVMHGAWYVGEDFMNSINPKTKEKFGRIGVSWGCPAVSMSIAELTIPVLKDGSLIMHYHASLQDASLSGREVKVSDR